ncbi:DNA-processing protein DprA [Nocardia anaemiae]|uniref:DNA-processing protein DprA n=1 Tax=Nocardia anaemiae TaxID=263910 RepID=UPI001C3F5471|nr:DNA-processing protein DprA [Nocardia anaemiae]
MAHTDIETAVLLALLNARPAKMRWPEIASEVALRQSATALWDEHYPRGHEAHSDPNGHIAAAVKQLAEWSDADFTLVTVLDAGYPLALREIHQLPPVLFVRGNLDPAQIGVSVVGSRDASPRGLDIASRVAHGLTDRGIAVLSGLAAGIDTAAHQAAIDRGGRPIGVIGTGINRTYPAQNKQLHMQVAEAGALVSQFWPDAPPNKQTFPMRNATMSGLGRASVVVEASEISGARIQARVAVEHGRPVVLSDLVVQKTDWGKSLLGRPGVYEAGSVTEVLGIIDDILDMPVNTATMAPSLKDLRLP